MCGSEQSKMEEESQLISFNRKAKEFDYSMNDEIIKKSIIHKGNKSFRSFIAKPSSSYYIYDDGFRFFNSLRVLDPEIKKRQGEIYFPKWSEFIITPIVTKNREEMEEEKSKVRNN